MKVKYSRDDETAKMLDFIRENVVFDIGSVYGLAIGLDYNAFKESLMQNKPDWASTYAAKEETFTANIKAFYDAVEKLDN